jgi:acyl carrier protein
MTVTVEQLREIIKKSEVTTKDPASFDPETPLRKQGLDSLDMATFVFFIETEFDLSIPHTEYKNLGTLSSIAEAMTAQGDEWAKTSK